MHHSASSPPDIASYALPPDHSTITIMFHFIYLIIIPKAAIAENHGQILDDLITKTCKIENN